MQDYRSLAISMFEKPYEELDAVSQVEVRRQHAQNAAYADKYSADNIVAQHFDKYAEDVCFTNAQKSLARDNFMSGFACAINVVCEISNDMDLLETVMTKILMELEQ